jgi:hypothetical protein
MRLALALMLAGCAHGAITTIFNATGNSGSIPTGDTTGGNLILCYVSSDTNNAICFDNQNVPSYTLASCKANGSGQFICLSYLYNFPTPGSTNFGTGAANWSMYVKVVAGAKDPSLATIQTASANATGAVSVSLTPSCTNSLVFSGLHIDGGGVAVSGLTLDNAQTTFGGSWGGGAASAIQTTATAVTVNWTTMTGPSATMIVAILATTSSCGGGGSMIQRRH